MTAVPRKVNVTLARLRKTYELNAWSRDRNRPMKIHQKFINMGVSAQSSRAVGFPSFFLRTSSGLTKLEQTQLKERWLTNLWGLVNSWTRIRL